MGLVGLIVTLLAIAFLLRLEFIFYVVYVCVGIYALSQLLAPHVLRALRISRHYNDHAFLGETVTVKLKWLNNSRLPLPWIEFTESIPPELRLGEAMRQALTLGSHKEETFTYQVQAGRRGYYQLGPLRLTTGDLFGFLSRQQGFLEANYLTVYPRIIPLTHLGLPSRLPFGTVASRQRLFEDPARPMGIRDYRSGDSLRQINWKASAHTRELVVKTFEPAISLETAVLLNLHNEDYSRRDRQYYAEWAIVVAASLSAHLINERQPVGLITNGADPLLGMGNQEDAEFHESSGRILLQEEEEDWQALIPPMIPPRNGRAHLMKVLERLARIELADTIPFRNWSTTVGLGLSWGVTILAITARGDEASCQAMHQLVRAGFNPILIAVEPDNDFAQVKERARSLGFRAFNIKRSQDIMQWQTSR